VGATDRTPLPPKRKRLGYTRHLSPLRPYALGILDRPPNRIAEHLDTGGGHRPRLDQLAPAVYFHKWERLGAALNKELVHALA
jgi:hypothetical protein